MYNGEHFSLLGKKKKNQGMRWGFSSFGKIFGERQGHKHSLMRSIHPESVCVGIMKMLWALALWVAEALLFVQVTNETLLAAADD